MLDDLTDSWFRNDLIAENTFRVMLKFPVQHVDMSQDRSIDAKKSGKSDQHIHLTPGDIEVMPTI